MVGDVNIFFNDPDNDPTFGEIEVMIAEPEFRRTGRGKEALEIIMGYGECKHTTILKKQTNALLKQWKLLESRPSKPRFP